MTTASKKVDAWMPLWIGDYLSDTMSMTMEQHGAYLLLLFAYWKNGGPLADDDQELATITRASCLEHWSSIRPKMLKHFQVVDGMWVHSRADKEIKSAATRSEKAASKAKAAADARWGGAKSNASGNAPSIPQALHEQCPSPSPSPITTANAVVGDAPRKRSTPTSPIAKPDDVDPQTWSDWLALRKAKRAPVTETVVNGARNESGEAGMTLDAFLQVWCVRGSQGLQADWLKPDERKTASRVQPASFSQQDALQKRRTWEQMTGRQWPGEGAPVDCIDADKTTLEIEQ